MAVNGSLTRNQRRVIPCLLKYRNVAEAAGAVGLGERTVLRWLAEDEVFRQALAQAEGEAIDQAARQLVALADEAVETLAGLMASGAATDSVRLRAADTVLNRLLQFREMRSIEERLSNLEDRIYGDNKRPPYSAGRRNGQATRAASR